MNGASFTIVCLVSMTGFYMMVFCNCLAPLIWWKRSMRRNYLVLFIVSIIINVGMWFERYNIIASALAHQYDPASWTLYAFNWVEGGNYVGFVWMVLLVVPSFHQSYALCRYR